MIQGLEESGEKREIQFYAYNFKASLSPSLISLLIAAPPKMTLFLYEEPGFSNRLLRHISQPYIQRFGQCPDRADRAVLFPGFDFCQIGP